MLLDDSVCKSQLEGTSESTYSLDFDVDEVDSSASCWKRFFPYGFWSEWKELARLAIPIVGSPDFAFYAS